jgi:hypothetical protein
MCVCNHEAICCATNSMGVNWFHHRDPWSLMSAALAKAALHTNMRRCCIPHAYSLHVSWPAAAAPRMTDHSRLHSRSYPCMAFGYRATAGKRPMPTRNTPARTLQQPDPLSRCHWWLLLILLCTVQTVITLLQLCAGACLPGQRCFACNAPGIPNASLGYLGSHLWTATCLHSQMAQVSKAA